MESIKEVAHIVSEHRHGERRAGDRASTRSTGRSVADGRGDPAEFGLVEENAATAKMLEQQAQTMDGLVAIFRIAANDAAPAVAPKRPASMHNVKAVAA